jgi:hypothetical protein
LQKEVYYQRINNEGEKFDARWDAFHHHGVSFALSDDLGIQKMMRKKPWVTRLFFIRRDMPPVLISLSSHLAL